MEKPLNLLNRKDVAEHFQISLDTVNNWTNKGLLQAYRLGGRIYYKRNEIDAALTKMNSSKKS